MAARAQESKRRTQWRDALNQLAQIDDESARREKLLAQLKDWHNEARADIEARLNQGALKGAKCAQALSNLIDDLIFVLADFTRTHVVYLGNPTDGERVSIIAVGGYGRARLAPYSDLDLFFLLPYKRNAKAEQFVEYILYILWDMGLKVGHATRNQQEALLAAREDMVVRTALLESRLLWGASDVYEAWRKAFFDKIVSGSARAFIRAKLEERELRHLQAGRSRYLVEPNIKQGKGGLRDLNTLFWLARYVYQLDALDALVQRKILSAEELRLFRQCDGFFWEVRCHLHFLAGRAQEQLSFDVQQVLAARLQNKKTKGGKGTEGGKGAEGVKGSKPVEQFMRRYFLTAKHVGDLTAILCAALDEAQKPRLRLPALFRRQKQVQGFVMSAGRLKHSRKNLFSREPVNFIRIFYLADLHRLDIHPDSLRLMTRELGCVNADLRKNEEANKLFLQILTSRKDPERALRRMNEVGVLGRFIPAFGRIVALMQFNMYHHYTADEHLLRAIGLARELETKDEALCDGAAKRARALFAKKQINRRVLYMALLLHDIAKGRPEDHSEAGARLALRLAPRFGFDAAESALVAWLVREHLLMSDVAQRRDLSDARTIQDFVAQVHTRSRLQHLFVLTQIDIQAVGPGVWTPWKAGLITTLYEEAEAEMAGEGARLARGEQIARAKTQLETALGKGAFASADIARALERHAPRYWLSENEKTLIHHAHLLRQFAQDKKSYLLDIEDERAQGYSVLNFIATDHRGLFVRLAAACTRAGLSILEARITTTLDGLALDQIYVQYVNDKGGTHLPATQKTQLRKLVDALFDEGLSGEMSDIKLPTNFSSSSYGRKKINAFDVPAQIEIHNDIADDASVIEVSASARAGLLYALVRALFDADISIRAARIATFGERAVDVFYVSEFAGGKITDTARLAQLRQRLKRALAQVAPAGVLEAGVPLVALKNSEKNNVQRG